MTIKQALVKYRSIEIDLLLADLLGKSKEFLYLYPDESLSADQLISLSALIKRRQKGEPIAYILGYKDFMGLRFKVNRDVLVPRPETEWVVERVIARSQTTKQSYQGKRLPRRPSDALGAPRNDTLKILDLGTGSGNIIISLVKTLTPLHQSSDSGAGQTAPLPSAAAKAMADKEGEGKLQFYASDISSAAIKVARQNAKKHHVKIKFIQSDLLKNIRQDFDIIIANLPYLAPRWQSLSIKFEPKQALFAKRNGLMIIERLLKQIADLKIKPKLIYLELDPRQKSQLSSLIKKSLPGSKIKFFKDYNGFWRYAEIEI